MKQTSFASLAFERKKKPTRRERFLAEMEAVVPWSALLAVIEPHYPKAGRREQAGQRGSKILEGHLMSDHVHICISIPPKYSVANVVGYIKGKSAISIARRFMGRNRNFAGENFWARGYFVSTVGLDEEMVRAYIRHQEKEDEHYNQLKLGM